MEEENPEDMIDLALMSNSINLTAAKSGDGAFVNTTINLSDDPLVMFSRGRITKNQSINMLGLRDYSELIHAMTDADLPMPRLPDDEIEKQAAMFAQIWRSS